MTSFCIVSSNGNKIYLHVIKHIDKIYQFNTLVFQLPNSSINNIYPECVQKVLASKYTNVNH